MNAIDKEEYSFVGYEGTIGRGGNVKISSDWVTIELAHLHYYIDGEKYYIEDLNSSGGTKINDKKIESGNWYEIKLGYKISMAGVPFYVE